MLQEGHYLSSATKGPTLHSPGLFKVKTLPPDRPFDVAFVYNLTYSLCLHKHVNAHRLTTGQTGTTGYILF